MNSCTRVPRFKSRQKRERKQKTKRGRDVYVQDFQVSRSANEFQTELPRREKTEDFDKTNKKTQGRNSN